MVGIIYLSCVWGFRCIAPACVRLAVFGAPGFSGVVLGYCALGFGVVFLETRIWGVWAGCVLVVLVGFGVFGL